jgi:RNA polymerase sigma factor (sigma-70 family)
LIRDAVERSFMASVLGTMSEAPTEPERREMIAARNALVLKHERLVGAAAKAFRDRGVDLEDLYQFGILGLMTAAEKFDPGRGFKFSTYARFWIRKAIMQGIALSTRPILLSANASRMVAAVARRREAMGHLDCREPLLSEVLDAMEADGEVAPGMRGWIASAIEVQGAAFLPMSASRSPLASPSGHSSPPTVDGWNRERLAAAMERLDEFLRFILTVRYGLDGCRPLGVMALASRLRVSTATVKRLEREAIADLRRLIENP